MHCDTVMVNSQQINIQIIELLFLLYVVRKADVLASRFMR